MAAQRSTQLPAGLARVPLRTVRAQHANDIYAYPGQELARLTDRGLLHRVAKGFYVVVPQDSVGREWRPNLEATAAGIASAVYGPANAVLMAVSAARAHGAIPRALATAVVAVPDQHRAITLIDRPALVRFVKRDTQILDAERIETTLGPALVTSPEQTVLDLAHRPGLGDAEVEVPSAVTVLYPHCDQQRLKMIATEQHRMASLRRAELWARAT